MKTKKELIDEIIFNFDFEKVEKVMKALDWEWFQVGIPSQIRAAQWAADLLDGVYEATLRHKENSLSGTGGFEAEAHWDEEEGINLELRFIVTKWSTYE